MYGMNSSKRLSPSETQIDRTTHPDWSTGLERTPRVGEIVMCTAGLAEVVKMRGKTGDGSRLLELKLVEGTAPLFYAAASNVLVRPPAQ